jgi:hypothetical protein
MFILFTNLFLARPFRLENTLECYNLRGGQGGSTEVGVTWYHHHHHHQNMFSQKNHNLISFAQIHMILVPT